jgi:lipopolysaccharide biosynthesis glycosyltransferase
MLLAMLTDRSWFDCDSVLLNPKLGLSHFLPPSGFSDANVLVTNDANGLNNGVFFIRVSAWAIEVMSANVAYRTFNPNEQLTFQDQSALDHIFHMDKFRDQVVYCPQRWFNAYQSGFLNETIEANQVRRGDLVVHFAGVGNKIERMNYWCDIAEKHLPDWEVEIVHTSYLEEIDEFWSQKEGKDNAEKQELRTAQLSANIAIIETERNMKIYREYLTSDEQNRIDNSMNKLREQIEKQNKVLIWGAVQELREVSNQQSDLLHEFN